MGLIAAEKLLDELLPESLLSLPEPQFDRANPRMPSEETVKMLTEQICSSCLFAEHDCDFMENWKQSASAGSRHLIPCGGFLFLGGLLDKKIINMGNIAGLPGRSSRMNGGEMEKYSVNEVIEQAVQTEKLGYRFYSVMADRFRKDEGLRQLFETLGEKELIHEKRFRKLKKTRSLIEPEGWEEASLYLRAIVESEFFLGKYKSLPGLEKVNSIEAALNFAMGFEKETLLYFHALRDLVEEKDIVDEIISEEKSHLLWLSAFRKELAKQR